MMQLPTNYIECRFLFIIVVVHINKGNYLFKLVYIGPEIYFLFGESKKIFLKKAKTGVVMTLFMEWATY
jgi:hypothetical protein